MAQVSALLRARHYSLRTEEAYVGWIKQFMLFHGEEHPETLGETQVESFLTNLAVLREEVVRGDELFPILCIFWNAVRVRSLT